MLDGADLITCPVLMVSVMTKTSQTLSNKSTYKNTSQRLFDMSTYNEVHAAGAVLPTIPRRDRAVVCLLPLPPAPIYPCNTPLPPPSANRQGPN